MRLLAPDIPPHVSDVIRRLPPDVKHSVKQAIRALAQSPQIGAPLIGELASLWKYRVRRFRIVYEVDRAHRALRIVAVGHRAVIYDELSQSAKRKPSEQPG
ncbi:MAG: type II toxin-antitoxin system RelE/ParE family toxin [Deltaproteobacteria bacterium]|nr:type II toxin-antitoxin system RelE/ParE family toxin [Deltaproteobacteria bacterium]MBI3388749.1 type II toxin-antitoxin system RelE/ParE family toxin [Deltaproteobacteria bacterium]